MCGICQSNWFCKLGELCDYWFVVWVVKSWIEYDVMIIKPIFVE
jgi:hypothetical protein